MGYDDDYSKSDQYFGSEPEPVLCSFADRLAGRSVVLDVGAGQGRNSVYLASHDFPVHALEPSHVAAEVLREQARDRQLDITVFETQFQAFCAPQPTYGGIMVFGLVPDLTWPCIRTLVGRIDDWSGSGTVIWLTGFTTKDPGFAFYRDHWAEVSSNSFQSPNGKIRTYLKTGQVLKLFRGYTVLHHWEGLGPLHRHGNHKPERHGVFELVIERP